MARIHNLSRSFFGSFGERKALDNIRLIVIVDPGDKAAFTGARGLGEPAMLRNVSGIMAGDKKSGKAAIVKELCTNDILLKRFPHKNRR